MALGDRQVLEPPPEAVPPPRRQTPVSWVIIGASAAMFLVGDRLLSRPIVEDGEVVGYLAPGALYGPLVASGEWWRVLLTVVEHSHDFWPHILFNMMVVFTLGRALELAIRPWRFLLVSLVSALGASALALLVNFEVPTVGASGMILGWAGAILPIATKAGRRQIGTWLVQVALLSLLPNVSWAGHLGGFLAGLPCGLALRKPERFAYVAPVLLFSMAVACLVAGSGRVRWS